MVAKKIVDLKNTIKKLCTEAKYIEKKIEEAKARYKEINNTVNKMQNEAKKTSKDIHNTEDQQSAAQDEKEVRLNAVIEYQTKAKWYDSLRYSLMTITIAQNFSILIFQEKNLQGSETSRPSK